MGDGVQVVKGGPIGTASSADGLCADGEGALCLRERFTVDVAWRAADGTAGSGVVALQTTESGLFWFFEESNWEMLVKVLDGCSFNEHFWVFAALTTDVEVTLTITDRASGEQRVYRNPPGVAAPAITDTSAFDTCRL